MYRLTALRVLWRWMKREVQKRKFEKPDELLAGTLDAAVRTKNVKIISDQKDAIFALELQIAFCLTKGFPTIFANCNKIVFSVQQICLLHIKLKLKYNKQ